MAIDVIMPQMGESIAEGTVIRWMKKIGDQVERDEPLFEISTDKVDAEIPSPSAGTLTEILAEEGKTVPVNSVVARLSGAGEAAVAAPAEAPAPAPEAPAADGAAPAAPQDRPAAPDESAPRVEDTQTEEPVAAQAGTAVEADPASADERRRTMSSPLVRKIAKENDVDITQLEGTGLSGRVTKKDILGYLEAPPKPQQAPAAAASQTPAAPAPPAQQPAQRADAPAPAAAAHAPVFSAGDDVEIVPLTMMRRKIADHMVMSRRTSAHVSTVFEMDFTAVDKLRRKNKDAYAERGAKLTFMPFIVEAVLGALRQFPVMNASLDGDSIVYKKDLNIGIAVALDWGLIVPVLKRADEKNILGLAKAIADLGDRAKTKKLSPDEVQGGTFTITNPGIFGGLFGLPIINQPQVAILGVGGVQKRPVVVEGPDGDSIAIRSMAYISLSFDHRLIDGAVADQFMAKIKSTIEAAQFAL